MVDGKGAIARGIDGHTPARSHTQFTYKLFVPIVTVPDPLSSSVELDWKKQCAA